MNDEACEVHSWGDAEDCETTHGNIRSPVCKHCGAIKLEHDMRARTRMENDRRLAALAPIPAPLPSAAVPAPARLASNIPPAGVVVHPFQTEVFTDI